MPDHTRGSVLPYPWKSLKRRRATSAAGPRPSAHVGGETEGPTAELKAGELLPGLTPRGFATEVKQEKPAPDPSMLC